MKDWTWLYPVFALFGKVLAILSFIINALAPGLQDQNSEHKCTCLVLTPTAGGEPHLELVFTTASFHEDAKATGFIIIIFVYTHCMTCRGLTVHDA